MLCMFVCTIFLNVRVLKRMAQTSNFQIINECVWPVCLLPWPLVSLRTNQPGSFLCPIPPTVAPGPAQTGSYITFPARVFALREVLSANQRPLPNLFLFLQLTVSVGSTEASVNSQRRAVFLLLSESSGGLCGPPASADLVSSHGGGKGFLSTFLAQVSSSGKRNRLWLCNPPAV